MHGRNRKIVEGMRDPVSRDVNNDSPFGRNEDIVRHISSTLSGHSDNLNDMSSTLPNHSLIPTPSPLPNLLPDVVPGLTCDTDIMDEEHDSSPRLISAQTQMVTSPRALYPRTNAPTPFVSYVNYHLSFKPDSRDWEAWGIHHRILSIRRWLLDLEWMWGAVDRWPSRCWEEWQDARDKQDVVPQWFEKNRIKVAAARSALGYLERLMEGQSISDVEEWRVIYIQGRQLESVLYTITVGLEHQLRRARNELSDCSTTAEVAS